MRYKHGCWGLICDLLGRRISWRRENGWELGRYQRLPAEDVGILREPRAAMVTVIFGYKHILCVCVCVCAYTCMPAQAYVCLLCERLCERGM
jgi:hypothetical protein